jgi:hypothetical protein
MLKIFTRNIDNVKYFFQILLHFLMKLYVLSVIPLCKVPHELPERKFEFLNSIVCDIILVLAL